MKTRKSSTAVAVPTPTGARSEPTAGAGLGMSPPAGPPAEFPAPAATTPLLAADAYAEILPELEALPASSIRPIKVDIPRAVSIAMSALPAITALRLEIAACPGQRIETVDGLRRYALGAWYAHTLALPSATPAPTWKRLLEEAAPLRKEMLVAAEALARRCLLDATRVAEIRRGRGSLDTANGLVALSSLFTTHWNEIASKTAVTREEVDRAAALAPELIAALGERGETARPAAATAAAADRRARAFTLLVVAYDACRRAVSYLRWAEGDADKIAPSLFKLRGRVVRTDPDGAATSLPVRASPVSAAPNEMSSE